MLTYADVCLRMLTYCTLLRLAAIEASNERKEMAVKLAARAVAVAQHMPNAPQVSAS
jgi:hypothetical protein